MKPPKQKAPSPNQKSDCIELNEGSVLEGVTNMEQHQMFTRQPRETKPANDDEKMAKAHEGAIYAQAEATKTIVMTQMYKAAFFEDQNMFILITMPNTQIPTPEAKEYL